MNCRITLYIFSSSLLFGCVSAPQFSGNSLTDLTLRNDVMTTVSLIFKAQESCSSNNNAQTKVANVNKSGTGKIMGANELWTVNGCGKSINYDIRLQNDAKGETDFSVSRSKIQP